MLGVARYHTIPLPKGWLTRVRSAVIQVISLARVARRITLSRVRTWPFRRRLISVDHYSNAKRIETVEDIEITWLQGVRSVGITSAASTPDDFVQAIVRFFQIRNPEVEIIEEAEGENITFRQPKRMPPRAVSSN